MRRVYARGITVRAPQSNARCSTGDARPGTPSSAEQQPWYRTTIALEASATDALTMQWLERQVSLVHLTLAHRANLKMQRRTRGNISGDLLGSVCESCTPGHAWGFSNERPVTRSRTPCLDDPYHYGELNQGTLANSQAIAVDNLELSIFRNFRNSFCQAEENFCRDGAVVLSIWLSHDNCNSI